MKWLMRVLLTFGLVAGLGVAGGSAQVLEENHYLIYETPYMHVYTGDVELHDQFGMIHNTYFEFDKFANPVRKNGEDYWDYGAHQNWYLIDVPLEDEWQVDLNNQFGTQRWYVQNAMYLVLPAEKLTPGSPPPQFEHNHYLCYEVTQAPPMNIPVHLQDQFIMFNTNVVQPLYFCNPCDKIVFGIPYPIVNEDVHLAVYSLQPGMFVNIGVYSMDQFEAWSFMVEEAIWLAVPTWKLNAVGNEQSSWGDIKAMYR
jgi:hypothetical protein